MGVSGVAVESAWGLRGGGGGRQGLRGGGGVGVCLYKGAQSVLTAHPESP